MEDIVYKPFQHQRWKTLTHKKSAAQWSHNHSAKSTTVWFFFLF